MASLEAVRVCLIYNAAVATTIDDIAREAGVSKGTVSLALNGKPNVSAHVRKRVIEASRALGYTPNRAAQQLARTASRLFLVLHPRRVMHQHYPALEIVDGTRQAVQEIGAATMVASFDDSDDAPDLGLAYLRENREQVSGVVLLGLLRGDAILEEIKTSGLPCVVVNRTLPADMDTSYVTVDHALAGQLAAAHLVALGHRRIGFVGGDPLDWAHDDRRRGFLSALAAAGLALAPADAMPTVEAAVASLGAAAPEDRPTGLVTIGDAAALRLLPALSQLGLRVPGDLSVVGVDGIPASETATPPLTTVRYDARMMGRQAVRMLNEQIDHPEIRVQSVVLTAELVERASTAPKRAAASEPAPSSTRRGEKG
jgi:DNA-binding LacI/PurR family transcriptional regulator